jgi:DNA-binding MarR family transcriptional regulator
VTQTRPPKTSQRQLEQIEVLAALIPRRAARLTRLLYRVSRTQLPRGMATTLAALVDDGPQRITPLAAREGVSQPTLTRMVGRLEELGYVRRERDPSDRRSVLVSITTKGRQEVELFREHHRAALRDQLQDANDDDMLEYLAACETLQRLIDRLQRTADSGSRARRA